MDRRTSGKERSQADSYPIAGSEGIERAARPCLSFRTGSESRYGGQIDLVPFLEPVFGTSCGPCLRGWQRGAQIRALPES